MWIIPQIFVSVGTGSGAEGVGFAALLYFALGAACLIYIVGTLLAWIGVFNDQTLLDVLKRQWRFLKSLRLW